MFSNIFQNLNLFIAASYRFSTLALSAAYLVYMIFPDRNNAGSSGIASAQQEQKQGDVNTLSTAIPASQEEALNYKQTDNILPFVVPAIPIHELEDITDNFSSDCLIDMRHFLLIKKAVGNVYRGTLRSGHDAAIKKLCSSSRPELKFREQVSIISSLKHENVAQLLGYCVDGGQQFLAYEFTPNGSLHDTLQEFITPSKKMLFKYSHLLLEILGQWNLDIKVCTFLNKILSYLVERMRIALDVVQGVLYLHDECRAPIIQCDIKPQNILMDDFWNPEISNSGLGTADALIKLIMS